MGHKNHSIKRFFTSWFGLGLVVGAATVGTGLALTDGVDLYYKNKETGLTMLVDYAHMKKGDHKVVISGQFYDFLTYETPKEDQALAINGIKKACETLNEYTTNLNFDLCTTVDGLEEYGIRKIDSYSNKYDIPLYLTTETLGDNKYVLASTDWDIDHFTRELKNENITYKRDALFTVWQEYDTLEETLAPKNSFAYYITAHELMHAMGFAHVKEKDSIMYPYISLTSPKDLTEKDIQNLTTYCTTFYGAEKTSSPKQSSNKKDAPAKMLSFYDENTL